MAPRPRQVSSSSKAYDRTETAFLIEKNRIQAANTEKTARLKKLRLAKEAGERELAAAAPPHPAKAPKPRARKKAAPAGEAS